MEGTQLNFGHNDLPTSSHFCCLLIIFEKSLDLYHLKDYAPNFILTGLQTFSLTKGSGIQGFFKAL